MSLGQILDRQLIDNLAIYIASREWKTAKELASGIAKFQLSGEKESDFVSAGWPVGKVHSEDHFKECCKKAKEKAKFYNIATGQLKKGGMPSFVYGDGWCVHRGCPEHIAIEKILGTQESQEFDLDMTDSGWPVLKGTRYIWDTDKNHVVGRLEKDLVTPFELKELNIERLKEQNVPFKKTALEEIKKIKL